jgi:hypothetical protein
MAFPGHEHTCTHAEPARATGRPRHTVQSCGAQAGRFLRGFPGRAAALRRPQLLQPCAKRAWIGSPRKHPPRARRFFCRAASAPEGSEKIRATRRAQDRRSPLTVKRTRAGAPPTPQRAIATLAQRPARHAHGATPRKSGSPAGTRRHRGLCRIAGRLRPRATTPCRSACPPIAHGPPQNFVLFSQDNVHSKTNLILGVFLIRPVPQSRAASRKGDIRES